MNRDRVVTGGDVLDENTDRYLGALRGERSWDGLDFADALEVLSEAALTPAPARKESP